MNRIIILSNFFKPGFKAGGPIKSLDLLCKNLRNDFEILVITSAYDIDSTETYAKIELDKILKKDGYKIVYLSKYNLSNILLYIKKFNPNLIYLNSIFSLQNIFIFALNKFIKLPKIILSPRGEISLNTLKIKKYKKKFFIFIFKFFNFFNRIDFHATNKFESKYILKIFPGNNVTTIPNFSLLFKKPKKKYKKINKIRICFISRITPKKNLKYVIQVLTDSRLSNIEIFFDIWGPIEDKKYWRECLNHITNLPKNIQAKYMGAFNPSDQANLISCYELLFLPTLDENFGHVIFESMQLGIVPLISDNTMWTSINNCGGGSFPLQNKDKFVSYLLDFSRLDNKKFSKISKMMIQYSYSNSDNLTYKKKYKSFFNEKSK
jgi:glycosyltransferase involved in cell wall biosynthesis